MTDDRREQLSVPMTFGELAAHLETLRKLPEAWSLYEHLTVEVRWSPEEYMAAHRRQREAMR